MSKQATTLTGGASAASEIIPVPHHICPFHGCAYCLDAGKLHRAPLLSDGTPDWSRGAKASASDHDSVLIHRVVSEFLTITGNQAKSAMIASHARVHAALNRIAEIADGYPDPLTNDIDWGHVGDLNRIASALEEIAAN